jgi:hypothetical protein
MKSNLERLKREVALPSFKGLSGIFFKGLRTSVRTAGL